MTGAEFSEVDFDRLADYVGGALDGTPEEAVVAALIADEPAWRAAHDELAEAMTAVGARLNAFGAAPEPMPTEVSAQLDAAFAADHPWRTVADARPVAGYSPDVTGPAAIEPSLAVPGAPRNEISGDGGASGRHLRAVPDASEKEPIRSRSRSRRWAAPIAAAAGVIAFIGFAADHLANRTNATSSAAGVAPRIQSDSGSGSAGTGPVIVASGTDYQAATLGTLQPMSAADTAKALREPGPSPESDRALSRPLARLQARAALQDCLDAISVANAAGGFVAESVDYASYEGLPAVVVRFSATNGSWVWASGADCGSPGVGAGKLAAVKVG